MGRTTKENLGLLRKLRTLARPRLPGIEGRLDEMRELLGEKPKKRKQKDTEGENRMEAGGIDRQE